MPRVAAQRATETFIAKATRADHALKRTATQHVHAQQQASGEQIARKRTATGHARTQRQPSREQIARKAACGSVA